MSARAFTTILSLILMAGPLAMGGVRADVMEDAVVDALAARTDELQFAGGLEIEGVRIAAKELLPAIYADRGFRPLWTDENRVRELLRLLETAPEHGLATSDYHLEALRAQIAQSGEGGSPLALADRDILLTEALIRFGYHQIFGKVNPAMLDPNVNFERRFLTDEPPVISVPRIIGSSEPFENVFANYLGRTPIYYQLQHLLLEHRRIAAAGGWPAVPPGKTLREGDDEPRVVALRRRLAVTGDLGPGADTESSLFDDTLATAVADFQGRHGLGVDGVVGRKTHAALSVPVEDRIDQLRLSLERLRWVRAERQERFVAVNIAGFRVFFHDRGGIAWMARAMVGKAYRQTPIFRGRMQYMEINPTWTVPPVVLEGDVLPAIKRDPGYLQKQNMSVIDRDGRRVDPSSIDWHAYSRGIPYSIRQEAGPRNALGEIKFIFPNKHFVFLHDTPNRGLFDQPQRTFSSGCIRVENPFELAELLLDAPEKWNRQTLEAVRDSRETRRIPTPERTSVLILYLTASVEPDGRARFLEDIYGRDAKLLEALNGPVRMDLPGG